MRTVNINLPKAWSELSEKQLLFISKLFILDFSSDPYKFLTHVLVKIARIKIKSTFKNGILLEDYIIRIRGEKKFRISTSQFHALAKSLDFLLEPVSGVNTLKSIRRRRPCNKRMYGTKFIQFLTAENYYLAFINTKETKYLRCLTATIYNKPNEPFKESLVSKNSFAFFFTSYVKLYAVYLWYSGFRSYLAIEFPYIFSVSKESDPGLQPKPKEYLMSLIRGLSDGDVTKNDHIQMQVNTMDALFELNQKAKEITELKNK
jgi:hypothetical protein